MQIPTITRPDDIHLHLCGGDIPQTVTPYITRQMGCIVIMSSLKPPIVSVADAPTYKVRIMAALSEGGAFTPLITLYLTDQAVPELVREAEAAGIAAFKLYSADATTSSDSSVTGLFKLIPILEETTKQGILFLVRSEVTDPKIGIFDRKAAFIKRVMRPVLARVPGLKAAFEHIITTEAARLVLDVDDNVAAPITPQHLLLSRNDLLVGGMHPRHFCLPALKREAHRRALVVAVTGEKVRKFFLNTDSTPRAKSVKENVCDCTGMSSAMTAIELYTEVSEEAGTLDKLEVLSSKNGAGFYGILENTDTITLVK